MTHVVIHFWIHYSITRLVSAFICTILSQSRVEGNKEIREAGRLCHIEGDAFASLGARN